MTRLLAILAAATVAIAVTSNGSTAYADDLGQVSQAQLAEFGLGSMETLSDEEGMEIRGKRRRRPRVRINHNLNFNIGAVFAKNIFIVNGPVIFGRRGGGGAP